jgi:hypothetical protein
MKRITFVWIMIVIVLLLFCPLAFAKSQVESLVDAVAYWQEQAILAAIERDRVVEELARIRTERDDLLKDRVTLEEIVSRLKSERDDALAIARAESLLRQQLEAALMKLAGPRFGVILGVTYDPRNRDPSILAALQFQWK